MKKLFTSILIFLSLFANGQIKRVLFLGNSSTYVNNLPQITSDIANAMGDTLIYDFNTPGGYTLEEHSTDSSSLNKIMQGNWDFVVLQGSQRLSYPIEQVKVEVLPYAHYLDSVINVYNPCGETMFFMTWGKKNGDAANCAIWESVCTYEGMDDLIQEHYRIMADSNKAVIAPVGAIWRYIRELYPSIELFVEDEIHPSKAGSYAAACSFYSAIFRDDPSLIPYNYTLSPEVAEHIKTAVKRVMYDDLLSWHIGEYDLLSDFSYSQLSAYTFQFTNQSQNEIGQMWNFGTLVDHSFNPTFTFSGSGTYPVQLSSFNQCDTVVSNQEIFVADINTAIEGIEKADNSVFYPNPASDKIFLNQNSITGISIRIYGLGGGSVFTIDHLLSTEIDISSLISGLYVLEIIRGNDIISTRLMIQK